jgi:hypothetical protein
MGHSINFALQLFCFTLCAFGLFHCKWENKLRAEGKRDARVEGLSEDQVRGLGHRNPRFRYME